MTLVVSSRHKAVVIDYPKEDVEGRTIDIRAKNIETMSVGERKNLPNKGWFVLFYKRDFKGSDEITVKGSDGGEIKQVVSIP